ncbi:MAG: hypothetical protein LBN74_02365 [Prevotella sp.]|jgi:hypothetical protein|nr:hypothetical protein [Prevotella sp.]
MSRIQTPVSGITTTSTYNEGECFSLINLRPKNGALHPVSPRKVVQELSQKYDIVFVHQNNDYQNWLGITTVGDYSSVYWDVRNEQPENIAPHIPGKINSVQQIGNTVSLITSDNIYYLFYRGGSYASLGEMPQVPVINLKTSDRMSFCELYFNSEYDSGTINADNFIDATKGLVNKAMNVMMYDGYTDNDGVYHEPLGLQLFDACFIRYAFRLYDGTLTKHSPPILIMPVRAIVGEPDSGNNESVKSITYKQILGEFVNNQSHIRVFGYRIGMFYDTTLGGNYENWKDIIQSVDIFMSAPLGVSNIENIRKDMILNISLSTTRSYNLIKGISADALKNISNTSSFYFIKSIELGKVIGSIQQPELIPSNDLEISKMENLIFQEVMSDDNFSNHTIGAEKSFVYNNRLNLADIKTTFFKGFNPDYFLWHNTLTQYPDIKYPETTNIVPGNYNGYKYADAPGEIFFSLLIQIDIEVDSAIQKVYQYASVILSSIYKMFMSAFLSYPDSRAKRITIYRRSGGNWYQVFSRPLEKHNFLNLSYFLNDGLLPIVENVSPVLIDQLPDTNTVVTTNEPNKVKVSELNNPLNFPSINTYRIGNGTILAIATNAMNVSDRNYGQYPVFIFTTQGIWTLNVGSGEVVYSTQSAPTYTEPPITDMICETPFGVVFVTKRGLQIINAQSVQFISPQLEEDYQNINIELPTLQCAGVIQLFNDKSFKEYLLGLENIIYNPYESELIISDKDSDYSYVLNFPNQSFYKSTERIDQTVKNVFPKLLVIEDNKLKDYSESDNPNTYVCLITRPLSFAIQDIKNLERIILRGLFVNIQNVHEDKKSIIMAHYSNDGINFPALRAFTIDPSNRKDYDMGLFASAKFRQFILSFAGIVDQSSKINFLDTQIRQEYNNTKMR